MRTMLLPASTAIYGNALEFLEMRDVLTSSLKRTTPINRGRWQSEDVSGHDSYSAHELPNVFLSIGIPGDMQSVQRYFKPDLPWAEDHFQERVSGEPLNPAPSYEYWPYHSAGDRDRFLRSENGVRQFDHTYPERMWPKEAQGPYGPNFFSDSGRPMPAYGIRFNYGDLGDVLALLKKEPFTRQAYLPIWFPEDTGATEEQRVPCTIGYHFIRRGAALDCNYFIRSCDVYRHFHNDVYMAARLTQWITEQLHSGATPVWTGNLNMFISNLHLFKGDVWRADRRDTTC